MGQDQPYMTHIVPFDFEDKPVRVICREGEPWFVLADVCRVLEMGNPPQTATRLDDDKKHTLTTDEGGKINELGAVGAIPVVINEFGLYSLILTSRGPD
jgi:prophage antirepressor-like protein